MQTMTEKSEWLSPLAQAAYSQTLAAITALLGEELLQCDSPIQPTRAEAAPCK